MTEAVAPHHRILRVILPNDTSSVNITKGAFPSFLLLPKLPDPTPLPSPARCTAFRAQLVAHALSVGPSLTPTFSKMDAIAPVIGASQSILLLGSGFGEL